MADDLDTLLRAAMKTLDEQVPSGYFEALPNQTLARLEGSMNQGPSGTTPTPDQVVPPPMTLEPDTTPVAKQDAPAEREEDSGLHDIRNLAQSTKQRLSKKSITNPPPIDNDVLAASSGSFKNIALPQPARMVSLPELDELPSKKEVLAAEKAAEKIEKSAKKSTKDKKPEAIEAVPAIKTDLVAMPAAPAAVASAVESHARSSFSLPSQQRKSSKGPLLAILGAGVAAAAGYVIFMQVNKDKAEPAASESAKANTAAIAAPAGSAAPAPAAATPPAPTVEPIPAEAPKDEAAAGTGAPAQIAADTDKAAEPEKAADTKAAHHATKGSKTPPKSKVEKDQNQKEETTKPETKPADTSKTDAKKGTKTAGGDEGEPSFDALLKEAGVQEKKDTKPKLDKKSLTGDDFKTGMSAVEGKAKACYKGTQGTALVKLTVGPTGKITKIAVAGEFSGKPEAMCIAAALRGATFPPWDGGPQSFTYAVLLSD